MKISKKTIAAYGRAHEGKEGTRQKKNTGLTCPWNIRQRTNSLLKEVLYTSSWKRGEELKQHIVGKGSTSERESAKNWR